MVVPCDLSAHLGDKTFLANLLKTLLTKISNDKSSSQMHTCKLCHQDQHTCDRSHTYELEIPQFSSNPCPMPANQCIKNSFINSFFARFLILSYVTGKRKCNHKYLFLPLPNWYNVLHQKIYMPRYYIIPDKIDSHEPFHYILWKYRNYSWQLWRAFHCAREDTKCLPMELQAPSLSPFLVLMTFPRELIVCSQHSRSQFTSLFPHIYKKQLIFLL